MALLINRQRHGVGNIVVARQVAERHGKFRQTAGQQVMFAVEFSRVVGITGDEITHAHNELRLQQVQFRNGLFQHARPLAAIDVGHHGEAKHLRGRVEFFVRPVLWRGCCRLLGDGG